MRLIASVLVALVLAGCAIPRGSRDGMDGYGVAIGVRHEMNRGEP